MIDNLPIGAANDSRAPYNEPLNVEHKRFVSVTISYYDKVYLPEDTSEEKIKEEIRDKIYNNIFPDEFDIDELVVLND